MIYFVKFLSERGISEDKGEAAKAPTASALALAFVNKSPADEVDLVLSFLAAHEHHARTA